MTTCCFSFVFMLSVSSLTKESVTDRWGLGLPFYPQMNRTFRGYLVENTSLGVDKNIIGLAQYEA
jgi:hypothetical protein